MQQTHLSAPSRVSRLLLLIIAPLTGAAAGLAAQVDATLLAGMKARSIGPAGMSGRVVAIDAVEQDPNIVYIGAGSGGLWRSTNGGLTFAPLFDDQPVASIGAIAIYQPSPDTIWVGTGEGNPRNSASVGNGVYRSTDGGRSWQHLGLAKTERIRRIWLHPRDPDIAFVAALGTTWGENPQRGLFQTSDGGKTWQQALYVDEKTGCIDVEVDPQNPNKMFASMWEHRRWPWAFKSGGKGSGLHRSVDGGRNWVRLDSDAGLPAGELGRIKTVFAPSNSKIVYALVEAKKNVLLRSDDGGFAFRVVNQDKDIAPRPFYYCDLRVDPQNPDRIYNLHSIVTLSTDGGKTFKTAIGWNDAHPDHHAMWIDPSNPRLIYTGNDGGVAISRDHGKSWDFASQLPLAQFYHIAVDMDVPYNVYGGLQDNGSWRGPNTVWENGGIRNHHWDEVCFGDGFATLPDPKDSMQGYAMSQEGNLIRWNLRTGTRRDIKPTGPPGKRLRFNWNAAIALDPFDDRTLYYGSQFVHKSTDRGDSWTMISPDLTTNHPQWQKQDESGGLTLDVTGAEAFTTIMTIAPSLKQRGVIWAGSDDGRVHVTHDGGESWQSVEANISGLPRNTWCPHIEASRFAAGTAYAVFDDHRRSNWTPYVYRTTDFGQTWQSIATDGLRGYCLVLEEDPVDANLLFLGTEFGLWFSTDCGAHWNQFKHGFPTCSAMALVVHPRDHDLVIGTHGRAAYVIDDIRPLRGLTADVLAQPLHVFQPPPAIQHGIRQTGASRFPGHGEFRGSVRPRGAMITFSANLPDLKHPDKAIEAQRRRAKATDAGSSSLTVAAKAATGATGAESDDEGKGDAEDKDKDKDKGDAKGKGDDETQKKPKPDQAKIEIIDAEGEVIRTFEHKTHIGLNRILWPTSRDGTPSPRRPPPKKDQPKPSGAQVLPGTYTVRITLAGHTAEGSVEVLPDPREEIPLAERQVRDAAIRAGEAIMARAAKVTQRLKEVKTEVGAIASKLARMDEKQRPAALDKATKAAMKAVEAFEKKATGQSSKQGIVRRRGYLSEIGRGAAAMRSSVGTPSAGDRIKMAHAGEVVDTMVAEFNELLSGPIARFSAALGEASLSFAPDTQPIK